MELLARRPVRLRLGTFFETWLATAEGSVRRSVGRDEYHLGLEINAGHRLAGTGRTHICQLDLEGAAMGPNQAREAVLVPAELPPGETLLWSVRTNLFLELPTMMAGGTGRLLQEGRAPVPFGLDHPLLLINQVAPGRFVLDVSRLLFL